MVNLPFWEDGSDPGLLALCWTLAKGQEVGLVLCMGGAGKASSPPTQTSVEKARGLGPKRSIGAEGDCRTLMAYPPHFLLGT